jgi:hypothetical protein
MYPIGNPDTTASPEMFTFPVSVMLLVMIVLGGTGGVAGVVLGALILQLLQSWFLQDLTQWIQAFGNFTGIGERLQGTAERRAFIVVLLVLGILFPQSVLMAQWNHLSWWNDRAVLFRSCGLKLRTRCSTSVDVLRRRLHGRVRLTNNDRWFFIQLYRWVPSILQVLTIIRPETLVRWHRAGFRCYALEIAPTGRAATNRGGAARADPANEHGEPVLGSAAHSR